MQEERTMERLKAILEEDEEGDGKKVRAKKGWWDEECRENKRDVRRELRRWRRWGGSGNKYKEGKSRYKELCERKRKEEKEKMIREVGEARSQEKVWELINRERR